METVVTSIRLEKNKLKETTKNAKKLKMSRNEYIDRAIAELNKKIEDEEWSLSIRKACVAEREARKADETYQLFSDMSFDGLTDEPNNGWWKE